MTRHDVITQACDQCLKELYVYAVPHIEWDDFVKENKIYSDKYKVWDKYVEVFHKREEQPELWLQYQASFPDWENKSKDECIGPAPFEFYYLPKEILKEICDNYIYAYELDKHQELLDTIEVLKNYCKEPVVDKYVEAHTDETGYHPGYKDYEHIDNLEKELYQTLKEYFNDSETDPNAVAKELQDKFFEFLDMAGEFYNWNHYLNSFNMTVYLGPSPNSNKQRVIENWKKYRNKDIEIDDEQIKKEFYGEDYE